ncbi:MAG: class I SAM-dependent methyltransferase [Opitutaceae bacterium]|jgi:2-polyprenyl-3-methyl-5-hydroxy-6-metoxy-1,4-benzoquinol methylase
MAYLGNPPPPELLKSELDWDIHKNVERARRRAAMGSVYYKISDGVKKIRAFFRSFAPRKEHRYILRFSQGPRVLDVGCGIGHIISSLPGRFVPFGIEPSPGMQQRADASFRARGGFCIHNIAHLGLRELSDTESFDLILMRSFLEHDVMAMETLKACHSRLAENGKVLIKVPNFACLNSRLRGVDWPGIRHPDHVNYFTPKTLTRLLTECGFSKVSIPLIWRLPTSDNLWALAFR